MDQPTPFQRALYLTLQLEGNVSNDPADHGGLTKWGVTQATYNGWRERNGLPLRPVTEMERPEMESIYEHEYWFPSHACDMPAVLAACHFDAYVNHSPQTATRLLQLAVGAPHVDGEYGPETEFYLERALHTMGEHGIVRVYLKSRQNFYLARVIREPDQGKFLRGWLNRVKHLAQDFGVTDPVMQASGQRNEPPKA